MLRKAAGYMLVVGGLGMAVGVSDIITHPDIPLMPPKYCGSNRVIFNGGTYEIPVGSTIRKSRGNMDSVSTPQYIDIARIYDYPDPECFAVAMKDYNRKFDLKPGDIIAIPQMPPKAGNQTRNQRELARP